MLSTQEFRHCRTYRGSRKKWITGILDYLEHSTGGKTEDFRVLGVLDRQKYWKFQSTWSLPKVESTAPDLIDGLIVALRSWNIHLLQVPSITKYLEYRLPKTRGIPEYLEYRYLKLSVLGLYPILSTSATAEHSYGTHIREERPRRLQPYITQSHGAKHFT